MLSCKQVTWMFSSGELEEATWLRRLSARMHFFLCRHCRRYESQIRAVGAIANKAYGSTPDDPATLHRLEGELLSRIPGGSSSSTAGEADTPKGSD
jgi:hypothetical protein